MKKKESQKNKLKKKNIIPKRNKLISPRIVRQATIFAHQMDGNLGGPFSKLSSDSKNELLWMGQEIADNLSDAELPRSNFEAYIRAFLKLNKNKNEKELEAQFTIYKIYGKNEICD